MLSLRTKEPACGLQRPFRGPLRQSSTLGDESGLKSMARSVEGLAAAIEDVGTVTEARQLEASAAAIYWTAWSQSTLTSPRFSTRDQKRVPQGWAAYPSRRSFLGAGASNRRATHPTNALLNYCHTLARCEASLALRHLGLDPMLGLLHNDTAGRDSLACDVQEAIRPFVEMEILKLLSARSFQRADFLEYPSGEVLLGLSLRQELCAYLDDWATAVASYAEFVRASLVDAVRETSTSVSGLPDGAPLSGSRRREDAAAVSGERGSRERQPCPADHSRSKASGRAAVGLDLSRLWRHGLEPSPRPLRRLHRGRSQPERRGQGSPGNGHSSSQAGARRVGKRQPGCRLRPGVVPPGRLARARERAAQGDRRGDRLLEGVRE